MAESLEVRRPGLSVWVLAARPRTLSAAVTPVVVGTAVAASQGSFRPLPALAALLSAISIQIGTNLANDYHDFERGADTAERVGPRRVTQSGLVAPRTVEFWQGRRNRMHDRLRFRRTASGAWVVERLAP